MKCLWHRGQDICLLISALTGITGGVTGVTGGVTGGVTAGVSSSLSACWLLVVTVSWLSKVRLPLESSPECIDDIMYLKNVGTRKKYDSEI